MAFYDALITAWNNVTQPPPGVTGAALTPQMTTDQRLAVVNAWTVTGTVPTVVFSTETDILNCINYSEFKALTATQQSNILTLLSAQGLLLGGSANTAILMLGLLLDCFPAASATRNSLIALAKAQTQTWCKANGYPESPVGGGAIVLNDCIAAGLS